ncbi:hypothetical protein 2 [Ginkgo biloba tombusvirus]|nr:hypothetical protein 2 [Ginkgo biloba tombusvirus]
MSVVWRALMERLYFVKASPEAQKAGADEFVPCPAPTRPYSDFDTFTKSVVRNLPAIPPVWTTEQFVASYAGLKAKRYASAAQLLGRTGPRRSYGYLKTFIKGEFYDGTAKKNPCPRLIQPRSPCYNILIGRYLRPAEKLIYKAIDRTFGHHVVLKCDAPWQRASVIHRYWREFRNPVFVGFDASRFDQHTSEQALEWEHSLYNMIFNSSELREYLQWQIDNVGYATMADGVIRYIVKGCRMSGDMNTALGNVLIMCALCHHYLTNLRVDGQPVKFRFIDDGDDCGVFLEAEHLHLLDGLPEHHLAYGYEMTVESPAYELEQVEFCQSRPIYCGGDRWMMVRNIHKALKQDAISIDKWDWAEHQDVLAATGVCGLAMYSGMPVLDEFYQMLARTPSDARVVAKLVNEHRYGPRTWRSVEGCRGFPVDETCARVSIFRAFGLLPDAQVALENELRAQLLATTSSSKISHYNTAEARIQYYLDR